MKCLHNKKNIYGVSVLISSSSVPCGPGDILELGSAALFAVQMWRCEKLIRQVPESQAWGVLFLMGRRDSRVAL